MVSKSFYTLESPGKLKNLNAQVTPHTNYTRMFKGGSQASGYFKYPWMILTCSQVWEPLVYNEPGCELAARDTRMTRTDIVPTFPGLNPK